MATNQFKPFATGPAANVTPQEDWEALPALLSGFTSGKASSAQVNKALRQTSFIASALAEFVSEKSGEDVLDDGDVAGFIAKMTSGFAAEYLSRENPFGDIKADGSAAVSTALANLGLGEGAPIIGSPFAWPSTKMPNEVFSSMAGMTFLKMNGATFSATTYPKLALLYPDLKLPDLRGEFIRGWDDGRGVDSGRALLSVQGFAFEDHAHDIPTGQGNADIGAGGSSESDVYAVMSDSISTVGIVGVDGKWNTSEAKIYLRSDGKPVANNREFAAKAVATYSSFRTYKSSTGWANPNVNIPKTAAETRSRNIALNYIVRAL